MDILIKVKQQQSHLNQRQLQMLRRMITVMSENGFHVEIDFPGEELHAKHDPYTTPFMGGKYTQSARTHGYAVTPGRVNN